MQNLVIFKEPSKDAYDITMNGTNMLLNRFCVDEDSAVEISAVYYLKKGPVFDYRKMPDGERKAKGKIHTM